MIIPLVNSQTSFTLCYGTCYTGEVVSLGEFFFCPLSKSPKDINIVSRSLDHVESKGTSLEV